MSRIAEFIHAYVETTSKNTEPKTENKLTDEFDKGA
jgi:hypothetical protein